MKNFILILFVGLFFVACGGNNTSSSSSDPTEENVGALSEEEDNSCPDNFVLVPPLQGYTTKSFCVAKYEMKNNEGKAVSQPKEIPWTISRNDSIKKCQAMGKGYDLITNDEWQTLARNIELVPSNWSEGSVGSQGGLSRGSSEYSHKPSDDLTGGSKEASPDDNEACFDISSKIQCDQSTWDKYRRTHTLSNGKVIWDLAGNVGEWVKDNNNSSYGFKKDKGGSIISLNKPEHSTPYALSGGTTTTPRSAKDQFGPSGDYTDIASEKPFGNLGNISTYQRGITLARGGNGFVTTPYGYFNGLFSVEMPNYSKSNATGFRCVYYEPEESEQAEE